MSGTEELIITTIDIMTPKGLIPVIAEATETPGLFVTPELMGGHFTGTFTITHAASGLQIPMGWDGERVDEVLAIAASLGTTPVDWTADRETVTAQISEHSEQVTAARRNAKYPLVAAEETSKLGAYPKTEAQATVAAIAKNLTVSLQHRTRDTWDLLDRDDPDGRAIYHHHASALVAQWALVTALREFAKVDQQAADATAREIWNGWDSGDVTHEQVWEWAREYGLPNLPEKDEPKKRPTVVTLCGSTRFKDQINRANADLTMEGKLVISLGVFGHTDLPDHDWTTNGNDDKRMLDDLHKRKIDLADEVFIVNASTPEHPLGYIGESTRGEIEYATAQGKQVYYLNHQGGNRSRPLQAAEVSA